MQNSEAHYQKLIEEKLISLKLQNKPASLYEPIRYMLNLGGKRFRPVLLLMCHELFNEDPKEVIKPALGIEVFHNFTLLHDDIMDKAPLRRTKETVHTKWNSDIAILSGDAMFVLSCQLMMDVNKEFQNEVMRIFLKTAMEVCEGQQWDMDFESREHVSIDEYLEMISHKTASLIGCAAFVGALCAGAEKKDCNHLYEFGKNLGIAFQLHDDILDVYGDSTKFGKQVGGDILANKKTFLLLTAMKKANGITENDLNKWLTEKNFIPSEKIAAVIDVYEKLSVKDDATQKMDLYFRKALDELDAVNVPSFRKAPILELAEKIMVREK
jgi:geranylgeranyl diphosphate synthase type II